MSFVQIISKEPTLNDSINTKSINDESLINKIWAQYSYDLNETNRLNIMSFSFKVNQNYIIENNCLNVVWTKKDNFNSGKTNFSIMPFFDIGLMSLQAGFNKQSIRKNLLFFPSFLINASHYFILRKNPDKLSTHRHILPSIFVKNKTDLFIFQKVNWMQFSPGVGVRVYFGDGLMYWTFDAGYEKEIKLTFESKTELDNSLFFSIGIYTHFE
jgi:hypothetical protein